MYFQSSPSGLAPVERVTRSYTANAMGHALKWLSVMIAACGAACNAWEARAEGPRLDLNQDTPRGDVVSPHWQNWRVVAGMSARFQAGTLDFELSALVADRPLRTAWWRAGFDGPARMASDGVVCSGPVRLVIRGLAPGRHSLGAWHNALDDRPPGSLRVTTMGGDSTRVTPSRQVRHNDDAAASYAQFELREEAAAIIEFHPEGDAEVVLNGLEIDRADPTRRARRPAPADHDEHAPEGPTLAWAASRGALAHRLYLGTDAAAVERADERSPEYRGELFEATYRSAPLGLDHRQAYFWRVDEVDERGVARGEVWRFQIRRLAFPGAEGYGRFARGGRAGRTIEVTNLQDDGPGSLREAIEANGPRTIVFRVGGLIELRSKLIIREPYVTIAGETAPGDGICIKNYTFGCADTQDVIVRHLRIRVGDESGITQDGSGARGCDHVIFDHCSISWSIDEGFSSREARNITVQRCLIAEALHLANHKKYQGTGKGHSFAGSVSGNIGSFHHNLLAHCTGRNWSLAGGLDRTGARLAGRLDIRNNIVFNWRDRTTDGGVRELCFVGNLYLPGPATQTFTLLKPDPGDAGRGMRAFVANNHMEGRDELTLDNWSGFVGTAEDRERIRVEMPLWDSHVTEQAPSDLLETLLDDVGATLPKRDAVDERIVADVRARRATHTGSRAKLPGILDSQADAGGWPTYRSGEPPVDSDHDGLPDEWEAAERLDPRDPLDAARYGPDGFTPLERYLAALASRSDRAKNAPSVPTRNP